MKKEKTKTESKASSKSKVKKNISKAVAEKEVEEVTVKKTKKLPKINNKKAILAVVVLGATFGLLYYFKGAFVAAMVNGKPISRLTVINQLEARDGQNALDSLITAQLVADEAKSKGINITKEDLDAEIANIEASVAQQGTTLDIALAQQGMTMQDLLTQIEIQKQVEALIKDKIKVSDEEVTKYIEDNQIELTEELAVDAKAQIKQELINQKLGQESQALIDRLKADAKIDYFVKY